MMKQAAAAMVVALSAQGAAAKDSDYPGKWVRQAVCSDVVQSVAAPIEGWKWVAVLAWAQGYQFGHAISAQQNGGEGALGYTMRELKRHLERQFTKGMTWGKFKAGDVHIDHIKPLNTFDHTDPAEVRKAWELTNLRPMWAADNMARPHDGSDVLL